VPLQARSSGGWHSADKASLTLWQVLKGRRDALGFSGTWDIFRKIGSKTNCGFRVQEPVDNGFGPISGTTLGVRRQELLAADAACL
jgi:hypothetical protein